MRCCLIKNYCITVSTQKISSIHKLILQILGSYQLNEHAHFWPGPPKNHWKNFLLSWIWTTMQKISSFHQFILEIQPILEWPDWPHSFLATPIIIIRHRKSFWSTFNLCELVSTFKKSGYFIDLFWRYGWLKRPSSWLAENILVHISGIRIFPNMGFVQEHSKYYKFSL